jgi:hypothetical protein
MKEGAALKKQNKVTGSVRLSRIPSWGGICRIFLQMKKTKRTCPKGIASTCLAVVLMKAEVRFHRTKADCIRQNKANLNECFIYNGAINNV